MCRHKRFVEEFNQTLPGFIHAPPVKCKLLNIARSTSVFWRSVYFKPTNKQKETNWQNILPLYIHCETKTSKTFRGFYKKKFVEFQNCQILLEAIFWKIDHQNTFPGTTKYFGLKGSAVLAFIGCKHTDRQTKYILFSR